MFLCSLRTIADKEIAGFGFGRCKPKSGSDIQQVLRCCLW